VAETPDKETQGDKQPGAAPLAALGRVPAMVVSLSALAVIGACYRQFPAKFLFAEFLFAKFFLAEFLLAEFRSVLLADLHAEFRSLLFAEFQPLHCTASTQAGCSPETRSRQRGTEGYSVVAAAKRSCVDVVHAELRNSTGGFEKNIPSTLLAGGAGGRPAECGGADDDFQHPAFKCSRPGHPGVAKNSPSTA